MFLQDLSNYGISSELIFSNIIKNPKSHSYANFSILILFSLNYPKLMVYFHLFCYLPIYHFYSFFNFCLSNLIFQSIFHAIGVRALLKNPNSIFHAKVVRVLLENPKRIFLSFSTSLSLLVLGSLCNRFFRNYEENNPPTSLRVIFTFCLSGILCFINFYNF